MLPSNGPPWSESWARFSKRKYTCPDGLCARGPLQVPQGYKLTNAMLRIAKVTMVRCSENPSMFGLILSISHTVADGHTYYRVLNMLGGAAVVPLKAERIMDYTEKMVEAVGKREWDYVFSPKVSKCFAPLAKDNTVVLRIALGV